jgi:transposase
MENGTYQNRIKELEAQVAQRDERIAELVARIAELVGRIEELERRLGLSSENSSKPPGSDGLRKKPAPKSLRGKSGKVSGGQVGHKGGTLEQVEHPDKVEVHEMGECPHCNADLQDVEIQGVQKRQVFDIPEPRVEVTEHQAEVKCCVNCGKEVVAAFPAGVSAPVQYGQRVKNLGVYMRYEHFIPEDRLARLFEDVFELSITAPTLVSIGRRFEEKVEPFAKQVEDYLTRQAPVKNLDETGLRVAGKLHWLHVLSNDEATHYRVSTKRGDIPVGLTGKVVHDHFKPYYTLENVLHGLCNAHHLRELKALQDIEKESWARDMGRLLKLACHWVNQEALTRTRIERIGRVYDDIVQRGLALHEGLPPLHTGARKRGRKKRRIGHNLLIRLRDYKDDALRFLSDPAVPFTNNQAEQDGRMMKVKQKISGGFRTLEGAQGFATARTFLSTMRKKGVNLFKAIVNADRPSFPSDLPPTVTA